MALGLQSYKRSVTAQKEKGEGREEENRRKAGLRVLKGQAGLCKEQGGRAALAAISTAPCSLPNSSSPLASLGRTCQEVTTGLRLLRVEGGFAPKPFQRQCALVARDDGKYGPTPLGDGQTVEKLP